MHIKNILYVRMVYQKNNFKTIRPLLNTHRFEIRQFVRFWKLPIYSDKSNQKTNYLRNKIRKQLMPTLRILFNPQIDAVLSNFVEIRKQEQVYFQNTLDLLLKPQSCQPLFVVLHRRYKGTSFITKSSDCKVNGDNSKKSQENACNGISKGNQAIILFLSETKFISYSKNDLNTFSRNQIIHWLIVNYSLVKKIKYYPNVFQRQVLKTIFKTFSQVENASLNLKSQHYEKKLTQLLIIKFTKKLFTRLEKKSLLFILKNIINKY